MLNQIKAHQQKIALATGFVAVATLGFWAGLNMDQNDIKQPAVSASSLNINYTQTKAGTQTLDSTTAQPVEALVAGEQLAKTGDPLNCEGKIKGSSTHKYHVVGGTFYKKTTRPIACFDTEAQAKAAGFVKSSR